MQKSGKYSDNWVYPLNINDSLPYGYGVKCVFEEHVRLTFHELCGPGPENNNFSTFSVSIVLMFSTYLHWHVLLYKPYGLMPKSTMRRRVNNHLDLLKSSNINNLLIQTNKHMIDRYVTQDFIYLVSWCRCTTLTRWKLHSPQTHDHVQTSGTSRLTSSLFFVAENTRYELRNGGMYEVAWTLKLTLCAKAAVMSWNVYFNPYFESNTINK